MSTRKPHARDRYFRYLARLSRGGRSNMYGAIPYLAAAFGLDREAAFHVICEWVDAQAAAQALAAGQPLRQGSRPGLPEPAGAAAPAALASARGRREPTSPTGACTRAQPSATRRKTANESPAQVPTQRAAARASHTATAKSRQPAVTTRQPTAVSPQPARVRRKPADVKRKRPGVRRAA